METRSKANERMRRRYYRRQSQGKCGACGVELVGGCSWKTCKKCRDKSRVYSNARYNKRKEMGLCPECAEPVPPKRTYCVECSMEKSIYDADYYLNTQKERRRGRIQDREGEGSAG